MKIKPDRDRSVYTVVLDPAERSCVSEPGPWTFTTWGAAHGFARDVEAAVRSAGAPWTDGQHVYA